MNIQHISPQELKEKLNQNEKLQLIDVRYPFEHNIFNIGGSLIPLDEIISKAKNIEKNIPVVLYCKAGIRSQIAIQRLYEKFGFNNLINLQGGMEAWKKHFSKIKVAAVNYSNTKPMIYAFEHGYLQHEIELSMDYPAAIAKQLLNNEVDVALLPVAVLPVLNEYYFASDYCIGCNGNVASVCLFSDVPLNEIETILLDYQSRTSVQLLKILLKDYWKISVQFINTEADFENKIEGSTAGLIIGDRAFAQRKKSKYFFDLGKAWKEFTGLPFVFAAWVSNKKLDKEFVDAFNAGVEKGLQSIPEIIQQQVFTDYDLNIYYKENLSYLLDEEKRKGLNLFLEKISTL